jgi:hypothetical protein
MENELLRHYLPETMDHIDQELKDKGEKWGDFWRYFDYGIMDTFIAYKLQQYLDEYQNGGGKPLPFEKIAALAHIAMTRTHHPELLLEPRKK